MNPGRPALPPDERRSVVIAVRMRSTGAEVLRRVADEWGCSIPEAIRALLSAALTEHTTTALAKTLATRR